VIVGAHHGAHEIKLHESNDVSIYNQVSSWLEVGFGIFLFIADKFGDLNPQEPESHEVVRSGIGHLPPALVWVSLINEARPGHGFIKLGKTGLDPSRDKVDHTSAISVAITDPIYQSSVDSDFEGDREVYLLGQGDELLEKTVEEI
jgi:hypothetical protein